MEYDTLYDVASEPFRWWRTAPCLIFLIVVAAPLLMYVMHDPAERQTGMRRMFLRISLVLFSLWLLGVVLLTAIMWSSYYPAVRARQSGEFEMLEGTYEGVRALGGGEGGGPDAVSGFYVGSAGGRRAFESPFPDDTDVDELRLERGDRIRVSHQGDVVLRIEKRSQ